MEDLVNITCFVLDFFLQKEEKETGSVGGEKWRVGSTRFGPPKNNNQGCDT